MSLFEKNRIPGTCIMLEPKSSPDMMDDFNPDGHLSEGGHFLCGRTGRTNGPDLRPADDRACRAGRSCYRSAQGF